MGIFGQAAARFLRTRYQDAETLAKELFAVFTSSNVDLQPASITINQPAGATIPPIVINQPEGSTVPPIQVKSGGTVLNIGGSTDSGGGGGIDLGEIEWPGQEPGDEEEATPPSALNPISLHGVVIGKVGGNVYSVRCWAKNPSLYPPIGVLQVEFPDVDEDEVIPNGARCPVTMFPKIVFNVVQPDKSIGYVPVFLSSE